MSLVTCAQLGKSLTDWVNTATADEKLALQEALGISPEQFASIFKDCEGNNLTPGEELATCEYLQQYVADAIANLPPAATNMDPTAGNLIQLGPDGLYFGIAESETVKTTGTGSAADPVKAHVKLSAAPANLIQMRADGLYLGAVAPPDTEHLYVNTVTGDDSNPGTKALPLKTIAAALDLGPANVTRYLYLHEGQTFTQTLKPSDPDFFASTLRLRGGEITFRAYGPNYDSAGLPGDNETKGQAIANMPPVIETYSGIPLTLGSETHIATSLFSFPLPTAVTFISVEIKVLSYNPSLVASGYPKGGEYDQIFYDNSKASNVRLYLSRICLHGKDPQAFGVSVPTFQMGGYPATVDTPNREVFYRKDNDSIETKFIDATPSLALRVDGTDEAKAGAANVVRGALKAAMPVYNLTTNINPDLFD